MGRIEWLAAVRGIVADCWLLFTTRWVGGEGKEFEERVQVESPSGQTLTTLVDKGKAGGTSSPPTLSPPATISMPERNNTSYFTHFLALYLKLSPSSLE